MRAKTRAAAAFTLIELLLVMVVILILVGIVIALAGPAQTRAARARATAEIEALRNGLERYKVDNAVYPAATATENLNPRLSSQFDVTNDYKAASQFLYRQLSGDNPNNDPPRYPADPGSSGVKKYFDFKTNMLRASDGTTDLSTKGVGFIADPWGYSYGYSTAYQTELDQNNNLPTKGYSPGYDLWSVAGNVAGKKIQSEAEQIRWIKTW